jgi:putative ABC transport system substrate-binding protein
MQAFLTRLHELGWVEGQTVHVEFRGAPTIDRMTELAADFVRMKADVIYAPTSFQVEASRRATKTIPIVFSNHGDPVRAGYVESLAQPGGNITGLTAISTCQDMPIGWQLCTICIPQVMGMAAAS